MSSEPLNLKHRFIVRSPDDYRVFAAIPVANTTLIWKEWSFAPDQALCETFLTDVMTKSVAVAESLAKIREALMLADLVGDEVAPLLAKLQEVEGGLYDRCDYTRMRLRQTGSPVNQGDVMYLINSGAMEVTMEVSALLSRLLANVSSDANKLNEVKLKVTKALEPLEAGERKRVVDEASVRLREQFDAIKYANVVHGQVSGKCDEVLDAGNKFLAQMLVIALLHAACPEGVPFAHYTVELPSFGSDARVAVNVVEGNAWITGRQATEDERRVVEIVSQMLVERALNPQASGGAMARC